MMRQGAKSEVMADRAPSRSPEDGPRISAEAVDCSARALDPKIPSPAVSETAIRPGPDKWRIVNFTHPQGRSFSDMCLYPHIFVFS